MLAAAIIGIIPVPIDLDRIGIDHARRLDNGRVVATFIVAKPPFTQRERTTVGASDLPDSSERWSMLSGKRLDLKQGQRVTVAGVLRVTDWLACYVDRVLVSG
jgi:hypothetical protein